MMRTVQAVIEPDGSIRLKEPLMATQQTQALVTVLDEDAIEDVALDRWMDAAAKQALSHFPKGEFDDWPGRPE